MHIKAADDKSKRVALLESLQDSSMLDAWQKDWLSSELRALKEGLRGERDAAHYLDNHFAADDNLAVIHDLRLEADGEVAQIDHLLISRGFVFYLLETKQFNGDLHINDFGEFSVSYSKGKPWSIPSPLEQSRRHQNVLSKLLAQLGISGRTQKEPEFRHVVLVNPRAHIHRPERAVLDTSNVIKADQFASWREKYVQGEVSVLKTLQLMANIRAADTVREWAQALCALHKPQELLALPDFMKPRKGPAAPAAKPVVAAVPPPRPTPVRAPVVMAPVAHPVVACAACAKPLSAAEQAYCHSHAQALEGQFLCLTHQRAFRQQKSHSAKVTQVATITTDSKARREPGKRKLVCSTCGVKISFEEGKFCWNNERRFGGLQYCRTHQSEVGVS